MKNTVILLAALLGWIGLQGCARTDQSATSAMEGIVRSQDEGAMEGVLVSARKSGSKMEITVVSDSQGRYRFPADRLVPGSYALSTWAAGYGSADKSGIEVTPNKSTQADLDLQKLQDKTKFGMQLSHTEWAMTLGSQKIFRCGECHVLGRPMSKTYEPSQWEQVIVRMENYNHSSGIRRGGIFIVPRWYPEHKLDDGDREFAKYLNSVAGPDHLARTELKTLPRPKGDGTKVILTSYDLALDDSAPHDVAVGDDGSIWHSEIALPYVGKFDPRTGEDKLYKLPEDTWGFPYVGTQEIQTDPEGNLWFGVQVGNTIGKVDKNTGALTMYPMAEGGPVSYPLQQGEVNFRTSSIAVSGDGMVWTLDTGSNSRKHVHRLNPQTRKVDHFPIPDKDKHSLAGLTADSKGNSYFGGLGGNTFGKVDGATGKVTYYPPPTADSGPRRMKPDGKDRIWFAEFRGNKVAMFDPATEQIKEWPIPSTFAGPFDVAPDKNGDIVWICGNYDDHIYKLDARTGRIVTYALPRPFGNLQSLSVDHTAKAPTVWVGEDTHGKITKIEVLDDAN